MKNFPGNTLLVCILAAAALSACTMLQEKKVETPAPAPAPVAHASPVVHPVAPPPPAAPVLTPDQLALKQGIDLYNDGNYNEAIKHLSGAPEIWSGGPKSTQLDALKYMAFSYCVTGRTTLCRHQFDKALKLDPGFDLAPGENGHPLWGPVFARAPKAAHPH
jgi:hypothetical protein